MKTTIGLKVSVQGREPGEATATIRTLEAAQRSKRAFKTAGTIALIGVGTVLIPVVHLFAPGILLIVAIVVYFRIHAQGAMLEAATVHCPACRTEVEIPAQPAVWPLDWNCSGCRKRLYLEPLTRAPEAAAAPNRQP